MTGVNGYDLSRAFWDWCFENPDKVKPNHPAMYFFIIEHCNRLGWKEKFGLPMEMTKDAIGISNYKTYSNTFNDLVNWGFIKVYQKSLNQYSATIVGLVKNTKANTKALSKATQKHSIQQGLKQVRGIVGIDKPINLEPNNHITYYRQFLHLKISFEENEKLKTLGYTQKEVDEIFDSIENYKNNTNYKSLFLTAKKWLEKEKNSGKKENGKSTSENRNERVKSVTDLKNNAEAILAHYESKNSSGGG